MNRQSILVAARATGAALLVAAVVPWIGLSAASAVTSGGHSGSTSTRTCPPTETATPTQSSTSTPSNTVTETSTPTESSTSTPTETTSGTSTPTSTATSTGGGSGSGSGVSGTKTGGGSGTGNGGGSGGVLAATGANTLPLLGLSAALVLLGLCLVAGPSVVDATRRRH